MSPLRQQRTKLIRKRAVASGLGIFAVVWGVVFAQLVSGHDPALAESQSQSQSQEQEQSQPGGAASQDQSGSWDLSPAPMTTQQS
jgi:hypothetical protein